MMDTDRKLRVANQQRVRSLSVNREAGVKVICAHDPVEFERAAAGRLL
jgi:hypothetical protein